MKFYLKRLVGPLAIQRKQFYSAVYGVFFWLLAGLVFMITFFPRNAKAAEFSIKPTLTVSEEYNDNLLLTPANNKIDYITLVVPELILHYETGFWTWDVDFAPEYRYYWKHTLTDDFTNILRLKNHTKLINNIMFIDFDVDRNKVSLDATRDFTRESPVIKQAEQNIYSVNPYVVLQPSTNMLLKLGYIYKDTHIDRDTRTYLYVADIAGLSVSNRVEDIAYADISSQLSSGTTLTTRVFYNQEINNVENYDQTTVYTGPQYTYAPDSFLFFQIGKQWLDFEHSPNTTSHFLWNAGITHRLSSITISLESTSRYIQDLERVLTRQDQYGALIRHDTPRTEIKLSNYWSEYRDGKSDELFATSRDALVSFLYRLTPRSTCTFSTGLQWLEDKILQIDSRINTNSLRIEHLFTKNFALTFEYQYNQSHCEMIETNNYTNNRILFGIKNVF